MRAKDTLLIIGAGGHGKVVADIALKMNKWDNIAFLDDNFEKERLGLIVTGKVKDAVKYIDEADFFVAVGDNDSRKIFKNMLEKMEASIATLIHPNAVIGKDVKICEGSVVMAGVVINSSTVIGKGCIINTSSSVDHDNEINDYVHISPGVKLAGTVRIGSGSWLGIGSVVSNNVNICSGCIIGAGAVVVKDINEVGTYVGVPARMV